MPPPATDGPGNTSWRVQQGFGQERLLRRGVTIERLQGLVAETEFHRLLAALL